MKYKLWIIEDFEKFQTDEYCNFVIVSDLTEEQAIVTRSLFNEKGFTVVTQLDKGE